MLPPADVAWLESEGVDPAQVLSPSPWRFFRVTGPFQCAAVDLELAGSVATELGAEVMAVDWLPAGRAGSLRFFRLPADAPLAQCRASREGLIQVLALPISLSTDSWFSA